MLSLPPTSLSICSNLPLIKSAIYATGQDAIGRNRHEEHGVGSRANLLAAGRGEGMAANVL